MIAICLVGIFVLIGALLSFLGVGMLIPQPSSGLLIKTGLDMVLSVL